MSSEEHYIEWHFLKLNGSTFHSYSQNLLVLLWLFAIAIFVPSLFLCIQLCRRRFAQQRSSTATTVVSPLPDHQWVGIEFVNHTVVPALTSMVGEGLEKECCICLSFFQGNEKLKVLIECEHVFHSECLHMWLSAHPSCPLCRASLHVSEIFKKQYVV